MKAKRLLGRMALRTKPSPNRGDRSFCETPAKILSVENGAITVEYEMYKGSTVRTALTADFNDTAWVSYDELLKLTRPGETEKQKLKNPIIGEWVVANWPLAGNRSEEALPIRILAQTKSHILYETKAEKLFESRRKVHHMPKEGGEWTSWDDLMALATEEHMANEKKRNPLIGELVLRAEPIGVSWAFTMNPGKMLAMTKHHIVVEFQDKWINGEKIVFNKDAAEDNWILYNKLMELAEKADENSHPLVGKIAQRARETSFGDRSFMNSKAMVLAVTETHMVVEHKEEGWLNGMRSVLDSRYLADWIEIKDEEQAS